MEPELEQIELRKEAMHICCPFIGFEEYINECCQDQHCVENVKNHTLSTNIAGECIESWICYIPEPLQYQIFVIKVPKCWR